MAKQKARPSEQRTILYEGGMTIGLLRKINELNVGQTLEITHFPDVAGLRYFEIKLLSNPTDPLGQREGRTYIRRADEHTLSYKMVRLEDLPED